MKLPLKLPEGLAPEPGIIITAPHKDDPLDEVLFAAVASVKGIEVECSTTELATAKRHKLYRRRKYHQARGNTSFDKLIITKKGRVLTIVNEPDIIIKEL